jgi:hypothetical protein
LQPGIAGVHDEDAAAAALGHRADEVTHEGVVLAAVDANAVLHRHRQAAGIAHGLHAIGHQRRLGHQAGAECAALHTLAGAAAVQVDFVIAPALGQLRAGGQVGRLAATELQRDRVLFIVEVQVARHVTVQQRAGGHHLGVQAGAARDLPVKVAAVAICPVHHRRRTQAPGAMLLIQLH